MKKLLMMLFILTMISCAKDQITNPSNEKNDIEKRQRQFSNVDLVSPCEASNLTFFIDSNCTGTPFESAILEAIQEYNDAEIAVFYTETSIEDDANVVFSCQGNLLGSHETCGNSLTYRSNSATTQEFPSGGVVGGIIILRTGWDDCPCTEEGCINEEDELACLFKKSVLQGIGSTLGLAANDDDTILTEHIEGTPDVVNDPNSIFNFQPLIFENCDWCTAPCILNVNDIIALQSLYPCDCKPEIQINGPTFLCDLGEELTYCIPNQFEIDNWDIPNNMSQISSSGNCVTVSLNSFNGDDPIKVTINDKACSYEYELAINTYEIPNFDISYNGPICVGDIVPFSILPTPSHQNLSAVEWRVESGGLSIMTSNDEIATIEATGSGHSRICAKVENECGNEKTICTNVIIQSESNCSGDGDIPNPK